MYPSGMKEKGLSYPKKVSFSADTNITGLWKRFEVPLPLEFIWFRFFVYFGILFSIVRLLLMTRPVPTVFKSKYINIDRYVWFISSIVKSISLRVVIIDFLNDLKEKYGLNVSLHSHIFSHTNAVAVFAMAHLNQTAKLCGPWSTQIKA